MHSRSLPLSIVLLAATMAAGLLLRFVPLGFPPFVVKYGGSFFWALLIYWLLSTVLPWWRVTTVALLAAGITTAVEFFKLVRTPALDAFRLTLPGILLLGRFFSLWDLFTYVLAITLGALLDASLRRWKLFC